MKILKQSRTVMVDIDDSVLLWSPEKYPHKEEEIIHLENNGEIFRFLPHKKNINFVKTLKLQGYGIVFWSASGPDWCERIVKLLKLDNIADIVMGKPEFAVDDLLDSKHIIKSVVWIDPITGEYKRNQ